MREKHYCAIRKDMGTGYLCGLNMSSHCFQLQSTNQRDEEHKKHSWERGDFLHCPICTGRKSFSTALKQKFVSYHFINYIARKPTPMRVQLMQACVTFYDLQHINTHIQKQLRPHLQSRPTGTSALVFSCHSHQAQCCCRLQRTASAPEMRERNPTTTSIFKNVQQPGKSQ